MPNYVKYNGNNLLLDGQKVVTNEAVAGGGVYTAPLVLITFRIGETDYNAKEGMTWAEWIESDYDRGEFCAFDDGVFTIDQSYFVNGASLTDVITDGGEYELMQQ
jgi:hypothetical protein